MRTCVRTHARTHTHTHTHTRLKACPPSAPMDPLQLVNYYVGINSFVAEQIGYLSLQHNLNYMGCSSLLLVYTAKTHTVVLHNYCITHLSPLQISSQELQFLCNNCISQNNCKQQLHQPANSLKFLCNNCISQNISAHIKGKAQKMAVMAILSAIFEEKVDEKFHLHAKNTAYQIWLRKTRRSRRSSRTDRQLDGQI